MAVEYSKKTNAELVDILKSRSLPHTGKKADMIARLQDADKAAADADVKSKTVTPAKVDTADDVIDWDDDDVSPILGAGAGAEAEANVKTGVGTGDADTVVGGKAAVANPTDVSNQQVDIDPSTTQDLAVGEPAVEETETKTAETTQAVQEPAEQQQNGTEEPAKESEETKEEPAPAVDYSMGLAQTDIDAEVARRKARAEKFGLVEETGSTEAQKAAERAKRFGMGAQDASDGIKGLDQPLSSERPRKRGRGDERDNFRRGKRRDVSGRGGGRNGGGGRRQPRNNGPVEQKPKFSEQDQAAMERRRQRFG